MAGRTTSGNTDPGGYSQDPHTLVEQLAAPAFDWIEQPIAAVADAFFDLITRHHHTDGAAHHGTKAPGGGG